MILYDGRLRNEMCPWSRVHLRNEVRHLFEKLPTYYGTNWFITVCVRVLGQMNPMYDPHPGSFKIHFNITPHLRLSLWKGCISFRFPRRYCLHFSSAPCISLIQPISSSSIPSPKWYLVRRTNREVPYYTLLFIALRLRYCAQYALLPW